MAGVHQLWAYDPAAQTVAVTAGTTNEGLVDGPGAEAWFAQPPGQKLDTGYGPSTRLPVSATPPELLLQGEGAGTDLSRTLALNPAVEQGVLHISAMAASCDDDPADPCPACHVHQQDWGVPVRLTEGGADRLPLVLAGMDEQVS